MSKNKLVYMLGLAPLLLGASDSDYVGEKASALNVTMALPKCGPSEYLSYQGAGLICKSFEAGNVKVEDCNSTNKLLTRGSGEFGGFSCTDKGGASIGQTEITSITNLTTISTQIRNNINNISTNPPASAAVYVGSVGNTNGRILSGQKVGLTAAAELCAAMYAGARMCTVYDIYNSVATGVIKETDTIAKAWVYMAAWNNPAAAPANPNDEEGEAGMNENCASYRYKTGDQKWVGVAFAWQPIVYFGAANEKGLKFFSGSTQAACNQTYPIACCK